MGTRTDEALAREKALLDEMRGGEGDSVGTEGEDRLAKLNRIANRAEEEREAEFADVHDDDTTTPFKAARVNADGTPIDDAEAAEQAAAEADAAAAAAAAEAERVAAEEEAAAAAPAKHKIKINGVEKEVTLEEALDLAQKSAAADDTFQKAAKLRDEAASLAAKGPPKPDVPADDSEELLALARALQVGTETEAVAALRKLKGTAPPPGIAPDEVFKVIDAKLAFNDANRKFEEEFADLVSDPRLERMVMDRDKQLVESGDKRPYLTRYREIGKEIRDWKASLAPAAAAPPPPADPLLEKQARKAAAPAVPAAASGKAKQVQSDEEPEESVHDTIAKMREARGGPQWARS